MSNLFKIAVRNLLRYKRRTLLTASLITIGIVFVLVFVAVSGSFKNMMIGQITDSMLGHVQIHRKGYVASIDNLPLNLNLKAGAAERLKSVLDQQPEIAAYSPRLKFGGMFSNFVETTNIRLNGVYPERGICGPCPLLPSRITEGEKTLKRGEILVPTLLAKGMRVKVGRHRGGGGDQQGRLRERQAFVVSGRFWRASPALAEETATSTSRTPWRFSGWKSRK